MKRIFSFFLSLFLVFGLCACGQEASIVSTEEENWQEQYDLGLRFLEEGNYEEAIIAFIAAIEIDPKQAEPHIGLAKAYIAKGEPEKALETLEQALLSVGEHAEISAMLAELEKPEEVQKQETAEKEQSEEEQGTYSVRTENPDGTYHLHEYTDGLLMRMELHDSDDSLLRYWTLEYDENGMQIKETEFNDDGSVEMYSVFEWDDGNTMRRSEYDGDTGTLMGYAIYEYEEAGQYSRPVRVTDYAPNGEVLYVEER